MLHRLLKLMCGSISVFLFHEMTIAKKKLTNAKLFANAARRWSATIQEIHQTWEFGIWQNLPPRKASITTASYSEEKASARTKFHFPPQNSLTGKRCISKYISKDFRSFSVVNSEGSGRSVNMAKYTVPSRPYSCIELKWHRAPKKQSASH